jgi:hypothetical protein
MRARWSFSFCIGFVVLRNAVPNFAFIGGNTNERQANYADTVRERG